MSAAATAGAATAPPSVPDSAIQSGGTKRAWYEVRLPAGKPKGIVLSFNGGGWTGVGRDLVVVTSAYRDLARRWRDEGFITVYATYSAGEPGWADVLAAYDQVHAKWPTLPIGAFGQSAGGHLALLLGAARPLAFVASDAGPFDLDTWRNSYPCYYKSCGLMLPGTLAPWDAVTGNGDLWRLRLSVIFGTSPADGPTVDDYSPSQYYSTTKGPDVFGIYGRRVNPSTGAAVADGQPTNGRTGKAYIYDGISTSVPGRSWETDPVVTQQQGTELAAVLGPRAQLRTLTRGTFNWIHGATDVAVTNDAYADMLDWTAQEMARAGAPARKAESFARTPDASSAAGSYTVRTCNDAPAQSGIFSTGGWTQAVTNAPGMDAVDSGCSKAGNGDLDPASGTSPYDGMQMRVLPFGPRTYPATSVIPYAATSSMSFAAPSGTTITAYSASYHGYRAAASTAEWGLALAAKSGTGSKTLAGCNGGAVCTGAGGTTDLTPPGSNVATSSYPTQSFALPAGTTVLMWGLACVAAAGCDAKSTNDVPSMGMRAYLDVYGSTVTIKDPVAPTISGVTGTLFKAGTAHGTVTGSVDASDNAGIRSVELIVDGLVQRTLAGGCDFSQASPCLDLPGATFSLDVDSLPVGPHTVVVRATDAARNTTSTAPVTLVVPEPAPIVVPAPVPVEPASAITTPQATPTVATDQPVTPAQPSSDPVLAPRVASRGAAGPAVGDVIANLDGRGVAVIGAARHAGRVTVKGATLARNAGKTVTVSQNGRRLGVALVGADGRFAVAGADRSGRAFATSRYVAKVAGSVSAAVRAVRRLQIIRLAVDGTSATVTGRVTGARNRADKVTISLLDASGTFRVARRVTLSRDGSYRARIKVPAAGALVVRATTTLTLADGRRSAPDSASALATAR